MDEFDEYVEHHSTIRSGAAGRATQGEELPEGSAEQVDEELAAGWTPPGGTPPESATRPPDMTEVPDPDGSHHPL
ncbi:hypothetical protein ACFFX1_04735 [Dactylosporangium sucinum]|uniref:Uncharacterized protein n=1 Tax=Dactylosporangium sucinum TaxID=1424081 RepID=A0A917U705_9ACTN|nr:hypothetical protein [Dactylosporangium sucinum]GGM60192.1 hypothetical protein GCM10007977_072130 [Dactylosporangium sucinum]